MLRTWEIDGYRNASVAWAKGGVPQTAPAMASAAREEGAEASAEPAFWCAILADEVRGAIKQWLSIVPRGGFEGRHNEIVGLLIDPRVSRGKCCWDISSASGYGPLQ